MPDRRRHRGRHPSDSELFAEKALPRLREATGDLAWLEGRGYSENAALELVGNRHQLTARQRHAVLRAACSDASCRQRRARRIALEAVRGQPVDIDGYNVLITVEAALAGGVVLHCQDETFRDLASVHGTWRRVEETLTAVRLVGETLATARPAGTRWLLDSPVSNSGRLAALLRAEAARRGWPWQVEIAADPDALLAESRAVIATSDSAVLDRCSRWISLSRAVVEHDVPTSWILDLRS